MCRRIEKEVREGGGRWGREVKKGEKNGVGNEHIEEVRGSMWKQQKYLLKFSLSTKCFHSALLWKNL